MLTFVFFVYLRCHSVAGQTTAGIRLLRGLVSPQFGVSIKSSSSFVPRERAGTHETFEGKVWQRFSEVVGAQAAVSA